MTGNRQTYIFKPKWVQRSVRSACAENAFCYEPSCAVTKILPFIVNRFTEVKSVQSSAMY